MIRKFLLLIILLGFHTIALAANTIVVFGDSLSAGYGIDVQQGWVNLLRQQLTKTHPDIKVINASISGNTTSEGLSRLPATLTRHQPDILILQLGANDGLRGIPLAVTRNNLAKMIQMAQRKKAKVLLVGLRLPPNYGPIYTQQFQALFPALAKEYKIPVVPLLLAGVDTHLALMQADSVHPTAQAQPIVFNNVWKVLKTII